MMLATILTHGPAVAAAPVPQPDDLPTGQVVQRSLRDDPTQHYFVYVPHKGGQGARLLVSVHGISRNAEETAVGFARRAERYGVVLVAPLFPRDRFPDYQRLGREGRGDRADKVLDGILAEVGRLTGARTDKLYLFGYSGGAQFAHRYTMAYPERVASIVIGAAGWYTFPDQARTYPRGIRASRALPGLDLDPKKFLKVPACVLVGERDITRDPQLRQNRRLDRQQGSTRVERGERWVDAMGLAAQAQGLDTRYRFELLPRSNHSFERSLRRGKMAGRVFRFLFGPPPERVSGADRLDPFLPSLVCASDRSCSHAVS
jgi:pimeloyl-ACP methyl ester carboxylesterase